jgi:hypothetical protein
MKTLRDFVSVLRVYLRAGHRLLVAARIAYAIAVQRTPF